MRSRTSQSISHCSSLCILFFKAVEFIFDSFFSVLICGVSYFLLAEIGVRQCSFCLFLSASAPQALSDFGSALYASVFGGSLPCQITEDLSQIAHILKPGP